MKRVSAVLSIRSAGWLLEDTVADTCATLHFAVPDSGATTMTSGWADKSGDQWFAMYEKDGMLTFRAGAWTCPIDGDSTCTVVDGKDGAAVFTVSANGRTLFEHRYTFGKWKKLTQPGYAEGDRLTDDFFAWVSDIWQSKSVAA